MIDLISIMAKLEKQNPVMLRIRQNNYNSFSDYLSDIQLHLSKKFTESANKELALQYEESAAKVAHMLEVMRQLKINRPLNDRQISYLETYLEVIEILENCEKQFMEEADRKLNSESYKCEETGKFDALRMKIAADETLEKQHDCRTALEAIQQIGEIFETALDRINQRRQGGEWCPGLSF